MTTTDDLINDLLRRAEACDALAADYARRPYDGDASDAIDGARCAGKAAAYRHAAELARDAVAAAVAAAAAEEREACARLCDEQASRVWAGEGWATAEHLAASIRRRAT